MVTLRQRHRRDFKAGLMKPHSSVHIQIMFSLYRDKYYVKNSATLIYREPRHQCNFVLKMMDVFLSIFPPQVHLLHRSGFVYTKQS